MTFRTRFAPSPTGYLHVGGARTALYCWLQARKNGGTFVLRIEDTDRERSTQEAVSAILESMQWLGLAADEGPFYQTDRFDRYNETIDQLIERDQAYYCYCSKPELEEMREQQRAAKLKPKYNGRCRDRNDVPEGVVPTVRFKNPISGAVVVDDLIRGKIVFQNSELDDLVIRRSDGTPTYNLTVVVDDADMSITHVIRGDDHINNTPRQINIFNAIGAQLPVFAHVPMILGEDGARLSKRHGAVSVLEYRKEGFLPEALLNYLARLGWSYGDQEIFDRQELVDKFDISDVNRAASSFSQNKLLWINQQYIIKGDGARLAQLLEAQLGEMGIDTAHGPNLKGVIDAYRERAKTMKEMAESVTYLFRDFDQFDEQAARKHLRPVAYDAMNGLLARLTALDNWRADALSQLISDLASELDLKMPKIAQPLRVAITGSSMSPSIDETLELVGKERALRRIEMALAFIRNRQEAGGSR